MLILVPKKKRQKIIYMIVQLIVVQDIIILIQEIIAFKNVLKVEIILAQTATIVNLNVDHQKNIFLLKTMVPQPIQYINVLVVLVKHVQTIIKLLGIIQMNALKFVLLIYNIYQKIIYAIVIAYFLVVILLLWMEIIV